MRDKIFEYITPKDPAHNNWDSEVVRVTGQEILDEYYIYWSDQMDKKYGVGRNRSNDIENCIEDYCTVNWASEVKNETNTGVTS